MDYHREGVQRRRFTLPGVCLSVDMWCPDCQEVFPTVPGSEVQVCPKCLAASGKARRRRRLPKLHPAVNSTARIRMDGPHGHRKDLPHGADQILKPTVRYPLPRSSVHLAVFGLFVFLVGQSILAWAFLTGHFLAWSVANLITVFGMVIAILSIASTLRRLERSIESLQGVQARSERHRIRRRPARMSRKPD